MRNGMENPPGPRPLRQLRMEDTLKEKRQEEQVKWRMMVSSGSYWEESDSWLSYDKGKWSLDDKDIAFEEVMSEYGHMLKKRAETDDVLRKLLESSR